MILTIVCLYGPDGAGKTTIASMLAEALRKRGFRVYMTWLRGTHSFLSFIARLLSRRKTFHGTCNPYYKICVPSKLKRLWLFMEYVAIIPLYLVRYLLPSRLGVIVIGDRCLIDFIAWIKVTLDITSPYRILKSFIIYEINRSINIYVRANKKILIERRPCEAEQIQKFFPVYEAISKIIKTDLIVDTSRESPSQAVSKVLLLVEEAERKSPRAQIA